VVRPTAIEAVIRLLLDKTPCRASPSSLWADHRRRRPPTVRYALVTGKGSKVSRPVYIGSRTTRALDRVGARTTDATGYAPESAYFLGERGPITPERRPATIVKVRADRGRVSPTGSWPHRFRHSWPHDLSCLAGGEGADLKRLAGRSYGRHVGALRSVRGPTSGHVQPLAGLRAEGIGSDGPSSANCTESRSFCHRRPRGWRHNGVARTSTPLGARGLCGRSPEGPGVRNGRRRATALTCGMAALSAGPCGCARRPTGRPAGGEDGPRRCATASTSAVWRYGSAAERNVGQYRATIAPHPHRHTRDANFGYPWRSKWQTPEQRRLRRPQIAATTPLVADENGTAKRSPLPGRSSTAKFEREILAAAGGARLP
jgi:hypothetical protein